MNSVLLQTLLKAAVSLIWRTLIFLRWVLTRLRFIRRGIAGRSKETSIGVGKGKTVLVTTGRQAKTLHIVRALKAIGAKVVVTDYDQISASAFSLACDKFILLPELNTAHLQAWVDNFESVLTDNDVDVVLPVSTINEVLFIGLARTKLEKKLRHITWLCPDLDAALQLDDRGQFDFACKEFNVRCPESGVLNSACGIAQIANEYPHGVVLKRIESSVNRDDEIVFIRPGSDVPEHVKPSIQDPWQWQRNVKGTEYSAWFVCFNGKVTFSASYKSKPDLLHFDPSEIPAVLRNSLYDLISGMRLTGQYAFDYICEDETRLNYVIECNPRASSVLETVSRTPMWAEAFFGIDVSKRAVSQSVGFIFHRTCWPWASRSEGYLDLSDPLPFLTAELIWPLNAIANHGLSRHSYHHVDVNICKIVVPGASAGRDLASFREALMHQKIVAVTTTLRYIDTCLLDVACLGAEQIAQCCLRSGCDLVPFDFSSSGTAALNVPDIFTSRRLVKSPEEIDRFIADNRAGETRLLVGEAVSRLVGKPSQISYRFLGRSQALSDTVDIPLRKLRVLHLVGSRAGEYYEQVSLLFARGGLQTVAKSDRFDSFIAYVHPSGKWSVQPGSDVDTIQRDSPLLSLPDAVAKIESFQIDAALSHMFDFEGLTAYRNILKLLGIPVIGSSAETMGLAVNKARTKAIVELEGVPVPKSSLLYRGDEIAVDPPFILKPVEEDNSLGLTLVTETSQVPKAIAHAFQYCDQVMCEEFIPLGRELRSAVIENSNGELVLLPCIEYLLPPESPVRTLANKLVRGKDGKVDLTPTQTVCPAAIDKLLQEKLLDACSKAHKALGCQYFSLYDFRIDPSGEHFMLEANLFCSFSQQSIIVNMLKAQGGNGIQFFVRLCERAVASQRSWKPDRNAIGMKQKM